jgi:hypothetical protein
MDQRMDPEMQAFNLRMEKRAAAQPPIRLELPFDRPRALTEALNLPLSEGARPPHPVPRAYPGRSWAAPRVAVHPWRRLGVEQHRHP